MIIQIKISSSSSSSYFRCHSLFLVWVMSILVVFDPISLMSCSTQEKQFFVADASGPPTAALIPASSLPLNQLLSHVVSRRMNPEPSHLSSFWGLSQTTTLTTITTPYCAIAATKPRYSRHYHNNRWRTTAVIWLSSNSENNNEAEDKDNSNPKEEENSVAVAKDMAVVENPASTPIPPTTIVTTTTTTPNDNNSDRAPQKDEYPLNVPSPILLAGSMLCAITATGSLFECVDGKLTALNIGLALVGFPLTLFLLQAAIQKGAAETLEDDNRYLGGGGGRR